MEILTIKEIINTPPQAGLKISSIASLSLGLKKTGCSLWVITLKLKSLIRSSLCNFGFPGTMRCSLFLKETSLFIN